MCSPTGYACRHSLKAMVVQSIHTLALHTVSSKLDADCGVVMHMYMYMYTHIYVCSYWNGQYINVSS